MPVNTERENENQFHNNNNPIPRKKLSKQNQEFTEHTAASDFKQFFFSNAKLRKKAFYLMNGSIKLCNQ